MDIYTAVIADFRTWMAEYDKKAVLQPSSAPTVEDCIEAKGDRKELLRLAAEATKTLAYMNTQKERLLSFEDALEPNSEQGLNTHALS